jgi:hypothetical protein
VTRNSDGFGAFVHHSGEQVAVARLQELVSLDCVVGMSWAFLVKSINDQGLHHNEIVTGNAARGDCSQKLSLTLDITP